MIKRMLKYIGLGFPIALLVITLEAFAQEDTELVTELGMIVVTASREKEPKREVIANVTVIDEAEISHSSARDLGELLAEKGIGHIHKYPGTLTSVGIRGFRTETHGNDLEGYVLVLLDGRRAGTGNIAKIMTKNIERIEIIRGPASVQYGSAAMGGVINVITKQGEGKPEVFLEGMYGSFEHREGSIEFSGKNKRFDFSGSYTSQTMDDYDVGDGERYYNTGIDKNQNSSLNLGYEFLPENRIGLIYHYFDANHAGSPGYMSKNDLDDYSDKKIESIDLVYDGGTQDNLYSWKLRYFDGEDKNKWVDPEESNPDGRDDGNPSEQKTDQKGAQAQVSLHRKDSTFTAGFDWVDYEIETTWDPKESEHENPAYFLLAKTKLLDQRFIISGGFRYDEYEVEIKKGQGRKESGHHTSPRIGIAYLLSDFLKLRTNYGEAFKMPSPKQLAADFTSWSTHYVGNPALKPEKSKTFEGGIDISYSAFNVDLTYFHTDYRDKIQTTTTTAGDKTWENVGKATIAGFEGNLSYTGDLFGRIKVRPYLGFVDFTKFKDEEAGEDLQYISELHLTYGITVPDFKGFSTALRFAYVGEQTITDYESGWPYPEIKKAGFSVANLTVSKKVLEFQKRGTLSMKGEIRNLFDKDYAYVKGFPMPERSFSLGLRYEF
ncbi:MAG: TonB-dependent receptor [Candidatus Hydrogenedentota bacterium]